MPDSRRGGDEGARACADGLLADRELDLAFEDEERVGVLLVDVRRHGWELGIARQLDHFELVALGLDHEVPVLSGNRLALAGA